MCDPASHAGGSKADRMASPSAGPCHSASATRPALGQVEVLGGVALQRAAAARVLAQLPDDAVVGSSKEPSRRTGRQTRDRPRLERCEHRGLNSILDSLYVLHSNFATEDCDEPPVFVSEEVLDQCRRAQGV